MSILKVNNHKISPVVSTNTVVDSITGKSLAAILNTIYNAIAEIQEKLDIPQQPEQEHDIPELVFPYDNNKVYFQFGTPTKQIPLLVVANSYTNKGIYYKISADALSGILMKCSVDNGSSWTNLLLEGKQYIDNKPCNVPVILDNNYKLSNSVILFEIEPTNCATSYITTEIYSKDDDTLFAKNTFNIKVGPLEDELCMIEPVNQIEVNDNIKEDYLVAVDVINTLVNTYNELVDSMCISGSTYLFNIFYNLINDAYQKIHLIILKFETYANESSFMQPSATEIASAYEAIEQFENASDMYIQQLMEEYENDYEIVMLYIDKCNSILDRIGAYIHIVTSEKSTNVVLEQGEHIPESTVLNNIVSILDSMVSQLERDYLNMFTTGYYTHKYEVSTEGIPQTDILISLEGLLGVLDTEIV